MTWQRTGLLGRSPETVKGTAKDVPIVSQQADDAIPAAARDVDIVLVYTDIMYNQSADFGEGPRNQMFGDIPAVIGYWHGHRNSPTGPWDWTKLVNRIDESYPDAAGYQQCVLDARTL